MKFMEAVKAMKEGKKVNRGINGFWIIKDDEFMWLGKEIVQLALEAFEATDWEIVEEENKTLSDKEFHSVNADKRAYYKEDVKEAINIYRNRMEEEIEYKLPQEENIAKEIFGDDLI